MSGESDNSSKERPNVARRRPLSLNKGPAGAGRSAAAGGRSSSTLVVEKKRKRIIGAPGGSGVAAPKSKAPKKLALDSKPKSKLAEAAAKLGLSEDELRTRQAAILKAKEAQAGREKLREKEEQERQLRDEEERRALEGRREQEETATDEAPAEEIENQDEPAKISARGPAKKSSKAEREDQNEDPAARFPQTNEEKLEALGGRIRQKKSSGAAAGQGDQQGKARPKMRDQQRRRGKLTITLATSEDLDEEKQRSLASVKRARERERQKREKQLGARKNRVAREITIPEVITVQELASRMAERTNIVIKFLFEQGQMVRPTDSLDADTAQLVTEEFGHTVKRVSESDVEEGFLGPEDDDETLLKPRPPVVAVMGHVDHGKTSLLDALREANIAGAESGGITQHIGAYQYQGKKGDTPVTFLDTPGHAAFSAMRSRGAQVTDMVILVVAADDGVMPQTIEAIKHAKAAEVPLIVAVNKMDVDGADPNRVLTDLLQHDVQVEAIGGDVQAVEISALKKTGLSNLVEAISLQAEILELQANPDRAADGIVIESQLEAGRGPVSTVIVKRGTLRRGDIVVSGTAWGKCRALINEKGKQLKLAPPSMPVEILGLSETTMPGEPFAVVDSEARARELTQYRARIERQRKTPTGGAGSALEQMLAKLKDSDRKAEIPVLIKADVAGTAQAIEQALLKISNDEVAAKVVHHAAGGISEADILLAKASNVGIFGFNVRANKQARDLAEKEGVEIRYYSVIYDLIEDIRVMLEEKLLPEVKETYLGNAEILQVFNISKLGNVAGCLVTEGAVKRGARVRLLRNDVVIHEGELSVLRRFKDDVDEVVSGTECGMSFAKYHDLEEGDKIECFTAKEIKRKLEIAL